MLFCGKFIQYQNINWYGTVDYPSTLFDVFRRLPIARTVVKNKGSEREEAKNFIPFVPSKSVWMFDRGYPSFGLFRDLENNYDGYFLFRCPASNTFPAVEKFIRTGKKEGIIWITPSDKFKRRVSLEKRYHLKSIILRVIRLESPDGTVSALLTNLRSKKKV